MKKPCEAGLLLYTNVYVNDISTEEGGYGICSGVRVSPKWNFEMGTDMPEDVFDHFRFKGWGRWGGPANREERPSGKLSCRKKLFLLYICPKFSGFVPFTLKNNVFFTF